MKKSSRSISKKNLPAGLKRITNKDGKRVWVFGDGKKQYDTLREIKNLNVGDKK